MTMTEYREDQFEDDGGEFDTPESVAERDRLPSRDDEWDDDSDEFPRERDEELTPVAPPVPVTLEEVQGAALRKLRSQVMALGYPVTGLSDTEVILRASRELGFLAAERRRKLSLTEEERLKRRALPSSETGDVWGIGATLHVYRLTRVSPYIEADRKALIVERSVQGDEVRTLTVKLSSGGEYHLTRKKGADFAWTGTQYALCATPTALTLPLQVPEVKTPKLKVFMFSTEYGSLKGQFLIAARTLAEVNLMLGRSGGRNDFPHVQERDDENLQFALRCPFTLLEFTGGQQFSNVSHRREEHYRPHEDAPIYRAWLNLKHHLQG